MSVRHSTLERVSVIRSRGPAVADRVLKRPFAQGDWRTTAGRRAPERAPEPPRPESILQMPGRRTRMHGK